MSSGIAILGAGIFAKEAHLPSLAALGDVAPPLKAIYSRSEKNARDFAAAAVQSLKLDSPPDVYYDGHPSANLDDLLARTDISAVIVVLPIMIQPGVILRALEAGKHVLSEKPVAADVQQGLKLIATYNLQFKPKGLIWRIAENFEAEPAIRMAGVAIAEGKIGKIQSFRTSGYHFIDESSKYYNTPWRTVPQYQGGFLLDGGVHTIAALRVLLPKPLTHLSGFASLNKAYLAPHDTLHVIARADADFHGIVEMTFAAQAPAGDKILITGTEGWLSIDQVDNMSYRITTRSRVTTEDGPDEGREEIIQERERGVEAELADFFQVISGQGDGLGLGDPLGALRDVAFIQAALKSNGQLIDLTSLVP